jgi:hypothetical protein
MGTTARTTKGMRRMSNLYRGTDIVLNYSTVSKPDAFHARRL